MGTKFARMAIDTLTDSTYITPSAKMTCDRGTGQGSVTSGPLYVVFQEVMHEQMEMHQPGIERGMNKYVDDIALPVTPGKVI